MLVVIGDPGAFGTHARRETVKALLEILLRESLDMTGEERDSLGHVVSLRGPPSCSALLASLLALL